MAKHPGGEPEQQEEQEGPERNAEPSPAEPPLTERSNRRRGLDDLFIGRAAQLAVMAELLWLRTNVAIPEVDLGTDLFVFKDDREEVVRLQVKACTSPRTYKDGSGYSAKFALPLMQLDRRDSPKLYFALAVLRAGHWVDFLVVTRERLQAFYYGASRFGSVNDRNGELEITVEFRDVVKCSGQDLTDCRNAWGSLPPLRPLPD